MRYLMMIVEPVERRPAREWAGDEFDRMMQFGDALRERGVLLSAESLKATDAGTRVRRRSGRTSLVDGPFAEAKEMIGGFFLIDVPTRDAAVALAAECPAAEWCAIEIREIGTCVD